MIVASKCRHISLLLFNFSSVILAIYVVWTPLVLHTALFIWVALFNRACRFCYFAIILRFFNFAAFFAWTKCAHRTNNVKIAFEMRVQMNKLIPVIRKLHKKRDTKTV